MFAWRVVTLLLILHRLPVDQRSTPGSERPYTGGVDRLRATGEVDSPHDLNGIEALADATASVRKKVRDSALAGAFVSAFIAGGFEVAIGYGRRTRDEGWWAHTDFYSGISPADTTVIVFGLLTVVAALSIAVSTAPRFNVHEGPEDWIGGYVWAEQTSYASSLAAVFALAAALIQLGNPDRDTWPQTSLLAVGGALAVWVSAASRSWVRDRSMIARELARKIASAQKRQDVIANRVTPTSRTAIAVKAVLFIGVVAGAVTALVAAAALGGVGETSHARGSWHLNAGLPIGVMLLTASLLMFTLIPWTIKLSTEPGLRWTWHIQRYCFFTIAGLTAVQVTLTPKAGHAPGWTPLAAFLGAVIVPALLLSIAERSGRGPAVFAVQFQCRSAQAALDKARVRLQRLDSLEQMERGARPQR